MASLDVPLPEVGASTDAAELIGLGRSSRKQGNHAAALQYFMAAAAAAPGNQTAALQIAHTLLDLKRFEEADTRFRAVLTLAPDNVSALTGLGILALRRGHGETALEWFERAHAADPRSIDLELHIGRALQMIGLAEEAERRFRRVLERKPGHAISLMSLGDIAQSRGDPMAALAWFETAAANDPQNLGVRMKIGRVLISLARHDDAEASYRGVLAQDPRHEGALLGLGDVARLRGDFEAALIRFQAVAAIAPGTSNQIRVAGMLRELDRLEEADAAYRSILEAAPDDIRALLGLGQVELKRENNAAALVHFETAAMKAPDDPKVWFQVVGALRRLGRLDEAGAILVRVESFAALDGSELRVKQFEQHCATMQLAMAEKCLLGWAGHRKVPSGAVVPAMQLYAALGRWSDVLDLFRERVVEMLWVGTYDRLIEPLTRAVRATGRYAEACQLLGRLTSVAATNAVREARDQIVEEMRLLQLLDPTRPEPDAAIGTRIFDPMRAQRAELFAKVLQGSRPEQGSGSDVAANPRGAGRVRQLRSRRPRTQVYMCADAAYMIGTSVCLFSLFKHNRNILNDCHFTVFCDDDVLDLGATVFGDIGAAFSVPIDTRASSSLVSKELELRTGWGFFSPGRALSQAAYYRIYAARKLIDEGAAGRALYIDSDTCVFSGLERLIAFELGGRPLGVRLDDPEKASIHRAAMLLGVEPDRYFNSGVLLFDLEHPELRATLDRSIEISLTEQHRLSFVDQCALNLAFCGKFAILPAPFNMMVAPHTAVEDILADPLVMHFITQPKPWDPMYASANGNPWLREFAEMSQVVAADLIKRLLAFQYPTIARPGPQPAPQIP